MGSAASAQPYAIPIQVSGLEPVERASALRLLDFEIRSGNGAVWSAELRAERAQAASSLDLSDRDTDDKTGWLQLTLDRALAEGFKNVKVNVSGHLGATFYTERQSLRTPAMFRLRLKAPHVGRCFSMMLPHELSQEAARC